MKNDVQSILKFNLDTSEGRDAHFRACKADQAYRALSEIEELMRKYDKYGLTEDMLKLDLEELVNILRSEISEVIIENGIDLMEEYK